MAKTVEEIQKDMRQALMKNISGITTSTVGEWNLWTWVVSKAIAAFEVLHYLFRSEIEQLTERITPGTVAWYAEMCYRFQNGDQLIFDEKTALYYYDKLDESKQIIKTVSIVDDTKQLTVKVAKMEKDELVPLTGQEEHNFQNYLRLISIAGIKTRVVTLNADTIKAQMDIYYDPSFTEDSVRESVKEAMNGFRTSLSFDSMFYTQKFIDAVMHVEGVVTVDLKNIVHTKLASQGEHEVTEDFVMVELGAGYMNYDMDYDTDLVFKSIVPEDGENN